VIGCCGGDGSDERRGSSIEQARTRPRSADVKDEGCHRVRSRSRANVGRSASSRKRLTPRAARRRISHHWPSGGAGITLPHVEDLMGSSPAAALIMAGGRSERMRAGGSRQHKGLRTVLGMPLIEWNLRALLRFGFGRLFVAVNARERELATWIDSHGRALAQSQSARLDILVEAEPLGTIGAVASLPREIDCAFERHPTVRHCETNALIWQQAIPLKRRAHSFSNLCICARRCGTLHL